MVTYSFIKEPLKLTPVHGARDTGTALNGLTNSPADKKQDQEQNVIRKIYADVSAATLQRGDSTTSSDTIKLTDAEQEELKEASGLEKALPALRVADVSKTFKSRFSALFRVSKEVILLTDEKDKKVALLQTENNMLKAELQILRESQLQVWRSGGGVMDGGKTGDSNRIDDTK